MSFADHLGISIGALGGDQRNQQALDRIGRSHDDAMHIDHEQTQQASARPVRLRSPGGRPLFSLSLIPATASLRRAQLAENKRPEPAQHHEDEQERGQDRDDRPDSREDLVDRRPGIDACRAVPVGERPGRDIVDGLAGLGADIGRQGHIDHEAERVGDGNPSVLANPDQTAAQREAVEERCERLVAERLKIGVGSMSAAKV